MVTLEIRTLTINELADFFARQVVGRENEDVKIFHRMLHEYTNLGGIYQLDARSSQIIKTPGLRKRKFSADYMMRVLPPEDWDSFIVSVKNKRVRVQLVSGDEFVDGVVYKTSNGEREEYFIGGFHLGDFDESDCFDEVQDSA